MQKQIDAIDRSIFWQEHVRDNTRDPKQRTRCEGAILRLLRDRMDISRKMEAATIARGVQEQANWYDTSAE